MSEAQYGPMSYYWEGKMDGLSGYAVDDDSADDPEYVAGHVAGTAIKSAQKART